MATNTFFAKFKAINDIIVALSYFFADLGGDLGYKQSAPCTDLSGNLLAVVIIRIWIR